MTAAIRGFSGVCVLAVALSVWTGAGPGEAQAGTAENQAAADSLDLYEEIM